MLLKRIYKRDAEGRPGAVACVRVLRAGSRQNLTPEFIAEQSAAGILAMGEGRIIIRTEDGQDDLVWIVVRPPGLYCCHCDAPQGDSREAQAHLAARHAGEVSPDPSNPSGYRRDNFYACVREGAAIDTEEARRLDREVRDAVIRKVAAKYGRKGVARG